MNKPLILASGSSYRASLLARLRLPFSTASPELDESARPGETPANLAQRLALAKAHAIAGRNAHAWVIGSDQVASCDGQPLGKPGTLERAREQLRQFSGKSLVFYTAVSLVHGDSARSALDTTVARFRRLDADQIERYLAAEPAFDCAGGFKAEGLGIGLFDAIESRDPTALIGLPLVALARLLREAGFPVP